MKVLLPFHLNKVGAGFPSPATDYVEDDIDLNACLIKNVPSTFLIRVQGKSMNSIGIHDGDLLVVDRSLNPKNFSTVIANVNEELVVKTFIKEKDQSFLISGSNRIEDKMIKNVIKYIELLLSYSKPKDLLFIAIDGPAAAWSIGSELASALLDHLPTAPRKEITGLQFATELIEIPDRPMSESHFCDDMCRGDAVEIQDVDRARWTAERNAVASRGDQTSCMVEVGAIAFSNVAISTNPAELFVEFGLEIKERSPFEVTLVSELSNGYCGYVPTEHAFDEGGYETHRSVFSSRLAKNAGLLITEKSVEMLNQCANA